MSTKEEILEYLINFVEVKHPAFHDLPPCPFAKRERLDERIFFLEWHFDSTDPSSELLEHIQQFLAGPQHTSMLAYDPEYHLTPSEAQLLADQIHQRLVGHDVVAIPLHPDENFTAAEVATRQFPCFIMLIQQESLLLDARSKLAHSRYYQNYANGTLNTIAMLCQQKGAFFPNLWWTEEVLNDALKGGDLPAPILDKTVTYLTANKIHQWMFRWGKEHGWFPLCPIQPQRYQTLQQLADQGELILVTFFASGAAGRIALLTAAEETSEYPHHIPYHPTLWTETFLSSYAWRFIPEEP